MTVVFILVLGSDGHPERSRHRRGRVARSEGIVFAFATSWKPGNAAVHAVGMEHIPPPGKDFVSVCLMPDVPHQKVAGRIKNVVKGYRKLDHPQARAEVSSIYRHVVDYEIS